MLRANLVSMVDVELVLRLVLRPWAWSNFHHSR